MVFFDIEQRDAQNRAIGGNQRQINAQNLIQHGGEFADGDFGKLDNSGDDQNKGQDTQELKP